MRNVKVSVIIPFYNGEEYADATMNALMTQTLHDIEIICVDDDSTDDTYNKLMAFSKEDNRISVYKQKKSNAGAARNLGFRYATGEYLLFLDSDDLYERDLIEKLYIEAKNKDADVCVCDADQFNVVNGKCIVKPQYLRRKLIPDNLPFSRKTIGKYILYFTNSAPWNKMIKREFMLHNQILFQEIDRANDQYFSIMCLMLAERITVVKERLVHYKVNQEHNLTAKYSETPLCSYQAMLKVKDTLQEKELLEDDFVRQALDNKILNLLLYSLHIQSDLNAFCELYDKMKSEGFEKLEFFLHDEEYYFSKLEYQNLCYLMKYSSQEYLLTKTIEYRDTIARKNATIKEQNKENAKLQKEIERLQKKEKELIHIKNTKRYKIIWRLSSCISKLLGKGKKKGNE
ncbi:MAG: glycosyltransferase family 2 protein [Lachnospiraceae bacterium]|nr:glycosyltransferase family 2 protein [Lachnospiraceae bacterium]